MTVALPEFRPLSFEEIKTEQLVAMFPGDEIQGRHFAEKGPYISPAQIKMANRCLEQYRRRYVKGEKTPPAKALVWGSADHETFESHFAGQLATGQKLTIKEIEELFASKLDEKIEADGGLMSVIWDDKQPRMTLNDAKKAAGATKDAGVKLAAAYRRDAADAVTPLAVEERFSVTLPGIPVPVEGAIDLVADVPLLLGLEERTERIIDRKTAGRSGMNGEWHIQGRIYQLHKRLPIEWQLSVKNKTPKIVAFEQAYIFDPPPEKTIIRQVQRAIGLIASCYATYGPDDPWPDALASSWACGYCGFRPDCPWWA